jgi:hypothetical protein
MQTKSILFISSLLGLALVAGSGCSSSSSGSPATPEAGTGDDSGSSSSSSGGGGLDAAIMLSCQGGDCDGGACCATVSVGGASGFSVSSMCAASCSISMLTPQFCVTDKDCPSGYVCQPNILGMGPHNCNMGTSSSSSGGSSSGGSSSGSDAGGGDAGGSDAGGSSGGDAASDAPAG